MTITAGFSLPVASAATSVTIAIFGILGATVFLFLLLVVLRLITRHREVISEHRKDIIRPIVYEQLTSDDSPEIIADTIAGLVNRKYYRELEQVLLENARTLKGREMNILRITFERLGFADEDVRNLTKNNNTLKRAEAAFHLGTMRTEKAVPSLLEALHDRSQDVSFACMNSLSKIGSPAAVEGVVDYLSVKPDIATLRVAEVILERKQNFSPYLLEWLKRSGENQPDLPLIINLIGAMKDEQAVPVLLDYLSNPDPGVRVCTAKALGGIGDFTACNRLSDALDDENPAVRASAAEAMGRIQCDGSIGRLAEKLSDPYLEVKMNCAVALTQLGEDGRRALGEKLSAEGIEQGVAAEALQKGLYEKD